MCECAYVCVSICDCQDQAEDEAEGELNGSRDGKSCQAPGRQIGDGVDIMNLWGHQGRPRRLLEELAARLAGWLRCAVHKRPREFYERHYEKVHIAMGVN